MASRRPTVPVVVDGHAVKAVEGETVLELCRREGVHVPTLCWLEGLSVWGGCRLCVVEVDGVHGLRPACATTVVADMELRTDTPQLRAHRREIVELLFAGGQPRLRRLRRQRRLRAAGPGRRARDRPRPGRLHVAGAVSSTAPTRSSCSTRTAACSAPDACARATRSRGHTSGTWPTAASRPGSSPGSTSRGARWPRARPAASAWPCAPPGRSRTRARAWRSDDATPRSWPSSPRPAPTGHGATVGARPARRPRHEQDPVGDRLARGLLGLPHVLPRPRRVAVRAGRVRRRGVQPAGRREAVPRGRGPHAGRGGRGQRGQPGDAPRRPSQQPARSCPSATAP